MELVWRVWILVPSTLRLTRFDWIAPSQRPQSVGIIRTSGCKWELPLGRWSMGGNVVSVCIVRAECSPLMKGGYSSLAVIGGTKRALMLVNFWQGHSWAPVGSSWPLCSGGILCIAEWGCNHICLWARLCYGPPMGCPSHLSTSPNFTFTRSSPLCHNALRQLKKWSSSTVLIEKSRIAKLLSHRHVSRWSKQDCPHVSFIQQRLRRLAVLTLNVPRGLCVLYRGVG